jgi:hypothetical protein
MAREQCVLTPQSGCSHDAAEPECPRRSEVEREIRKINADAMTLNDPGAKKEPDSCNLFVFQGGIFQNALKKVEMRNEPSFLGGNGGKAAAT